MNRSSLSIYKPKEIEDICGQSKVELGRGGYGVVYKGSLRQPNSAERQQVAVKQLPQGSYVDKEVRSVIREIELA